MKNKLQKRLICQRLIRAPALLFAPAEALQGHRETHGGSEEHGTAIYFMHLCRECLKK